VAEPIRVGVHFSRHRGGPGRLTVEPGRIVLATRNASRSVVHTAGPVRLEVKRWEPPWGNHWIAVTDGAVEAHAVVSRRRAARILTLVGECGFAVERS